MLSGQGHPSAPPARWALLFIQGLQGKQGQPSTAPALLHRCLPAPGSISTSWHAERGIVPKIGLPHCIVTQTCSVSKSSSLGFSRLTVCNFLGLFHPGCLPGGLQGTQRPQSAKQPWKRADPDTARGALTPRKTAFLFLLLV